MEIINEIIEPMQNGWLMKILMFAVIFIITYAVLRILIKLIKLPVKIIGILFIIVMILVAYKVFI